MRWFLPCRVPQDGPSSVRIGCATFTGRDARDFVIPPEERPAFGDVLAYIWSTGLSSPQVGHWLTREGGRRLIAWSNRPMTDPVCLVTTGIDLTDRPKERFWLLVHKPDVEVCIKHPGFDEDLVLTTDCQTLTHVHMGRLSIGEAERSGCWTIDGVRSLARAVPTWGGTSVFAHVRPVPRPGAAVITPKRGGAAPRWRSARPARAGTEKGSE